MFELLIIKNKVQARKTLFWESNILITNHTQLKWNETIQPTIPPVTTTHIDLVPNLVYYSQAHGPKPLVPFIKPTSLRLKRSSLSLSPISLLTLEPAPNRVFYSYSLITIGSDFKLHMRRRTELTTKLSPTYSPMKFNLIWEPWGVNQDVRCERGP